MQLIIPSQFYERRQGGNTATSDDALVRQSFFCPKKDFDRFTPGGHVDSDERGVEAQPRVQAPA